MLRGHARTHRALEEIIQVSLQEREHMSCGRAKAPQAYTTLSAYTTALRSEVAGCSALPTLLDTAAGGGALPELLGAAVVAGRAALPELLGAAVVAGRAAVPELLETAEAKKRVMASRCKQNLEPILSSRSEKVTNSL